VFKTVVRKTIKFAEAPVKAYRFLPMPPTARPRRRIAHLRERCSMEKRSSLKHSGLNSLFRAAAAKEAQGDPGASPGEEASIAASLSLRAERAVGPDRAGRNA
jgi:hypothetical protein